MNATRSAIALAALLALVAGTAALAGDAPGKVDGEVVQVMARVRTANEGELDALKIRTRQGDEMQLLLGQAGSSEGQFQPGDRVRARLAAGGTGSDGYRVRTMKVRRTGESFAYRNGDGDMLQTRSRTRAARQDDTAGGDRSRDRARVHEPGTGSGSRGGGSRGGRGRR